MLRAIDVIGEPNTPIELNSLEVDQSGALQQREPQYPLTFNFSWRDSNFEGTVDQVDDRLTLELSLKLAELPFTAEDATQRGNWSAIVSDTDAPAGGVLKIMHDSTAVLSKKIDLPELNGFTADGFITNMAMMVLSLAPYLDLLAEHSGAHAPSADA
ncbi:MAG: hypothetical protein HOM52_03165 [Rhodospirillaceae bacterium]|jgi:hypothetical protein|nr:hypothetical protein [Rhodospirillaceae bacterium]MBT3626754.1 hypothetical protein [Rhodospirillaceae bacterium]MBT3927448.1 hypothetical protein [Rhodospirillaceae bacterium]MBT4427648.1 hypothetical protein [Rhodospirillaceae bacterium]MBT5037489.1 hypothetical protein [Rhodospirillaceae bacterium]